MCDLYNFHFHTDRHKLLNRLIYQMLYIQHNHFLNDSNESESPTSTNINDNQEIEIKDTKDLKIVPWIDDAPKNATTMTLNRLRQKVKKKKLWAIQELGERYEEGVGGLEKSLDKAIDYYKKGAILGYPRSMTTLGYMYEKGEGVDENEKLAFEHYQMGAFKGYDVAQFNVGASYCIGDYVEQSIIKAREWLNRAAAQKNEGAIDLLKHLDEAEEKGTEEAKKAQEIER